MRSRRRYTSFAHLVRELREGVDYRRVVLDRRSAIAIVAPHGGGIEAGTSEIASALAGDHRSLYLFEGIRPKGNEDLHVTSTRFDDPTLIDLAQGSRTFVSLHGCREPGEVVYLGGLHEEGKRIVLDLLLAGGFDAEPDRPSRAGSDPANLCNRGGSGRGVQLELSRGLRRSLFAGLDREGRTRRTPRFAGLVAVLDRALHRMEAEEEGEGAGSARTDPEHPEAPRNA